MPEELSEISAEICRIVTIQEKVEATEQSAGIAANTFYTGMLLIKYCYNTGEILCNTASQAAAAIVENLKSPGNITDCYYKTAYKTPNSGETQFGADAWPAPDKWTESDWRSLGSWNGGTNPTYPTLAWEE
ncbi:MAG: hypothetical protein LUE99_07050 [Bacteroides sp.]|nr:hypothetical protein [Bacteroides sp.]